MDLPVTPEETVALLTECVRTKTVNPPGEEARLTEVLARYFEAEGVDVEVQTLSPGRANLLAHLRGAGERPALIFSAHTDTVGPGEMPWERDPWSGRVEGGRLYGRGASDMKGAVALLLELFERLGPEGRARLPVEPLVVLYDREEGPYDQNGLGPVLEARRDLRNVSLALCLEPTDLALQIGCCGALHATFSFAGRTAHSARPWQGENAVHKAGALLQWLQQRKPRDVSFTADDAGETFELLFREVISCTRIDGFSGRNVVPARCDLNLNYRFAPGRSVE